MKTWRGSESYVTRKEKENKKTKQARRQETVTESDRHEGVKVRKTRGSDWKKKTERSAISVKSNLFICNEAFQSARKSINTPLRKRETCQN